MRRSALAALLAVLTAGLASAMLSAPATAAPGPDTLAIIDPAPPATYADGQKLSIQVNINEGDSDVFQATLETNKSGSYQPISGLTNKTTTSFGKYTFSYSPSGEQDVRASWEQNGETRHSEVLHLEPSPVTPGPDVGSLYQSTSLFADGDTITLAANFPSGSFPITLYKETAPDTWTAVSTKPSNSSGNADFSYEVNGTSKVFARKSNGESTEVDTLTPTVIDPANFTKTGSLTTNPTSVRDGRTASIIAKFPSDQASAGVTAYQLKDGVWNSIGAAKANSSGDATITGHKFDGTETVMAVTSNGQRTGVKDVVTVPPNVVSGGPAQLGHNVVYVTTDNGGTPVTKGADYEGKAVLETGDVPTETFDVETISVRGNSSADKAKKPYKLKFEDKQSPFGMKSDKTWILLANYGDWTLIRSMVAWDLGKLFDGLKWTPTSTFAELFINGKYLGSYQMVQSIKIDKNRVNVNKLTGQVIEFDPHWKEDGVPGMIGQTGVNYAWKDPDEFKDGDEAEEGLTTAKIAAMKTKIRNFEDVLYGEDNKKDWSTINYATLDPKDDWQTYLDLNSAVDYYLTREFTKDNDADMYRSNFFYTNNVDPGSVDPTNPADADKFFMGPIWDFDRSAGACTSCSSTIASPTGWWMRGGGSSNHDTNTIHWYTRITDDPRFLKAVHDRWAAKKAAFEAVGPTGVSAAVGKLGGNGDYALGKVVAANDRTRWEGYGTRYSPRASTYTGELSWIRKWYSDRYAWMDEELQKAPPPIP